MHEFSIAQDLTKVALDSLKNDTVQKVHRIDLAIGQVSGVVPDALLFAFPMAAKDTILEHSEIVIESIPLTIKCLCCGKESEQAEFLLLCSHCGSVQVNILRGKEIKILSMEVE